MAPHARRSPAEAQLDPETLEERTVALKDPMLAGFNKRVMGETHVVATTPGGQPIVAGEVLDENIRLPGNGRAQDSQFNALSRSIRTRIAATGEEPITILNFLPIPLVVNGAMQDLKVRIPSAPKKAEGSDDFSFYTWHNSAIEVMPVGEGIKQPWQISPIQIATAYMVEYESFGGVVLLHGVPNEKTLAKDEVVQDIRAALDKMYKWMLSKVHEGLMEWTTNNGAGRKNVVDLHRQCATTLRDHGMIDNLPEYMTDSRTLSEVQKKCPSCSAMPSPGAVKCLNCHWILDPAKALELGIITEEDSSLERLTRAEVEALGVGAFVAETADEIVERRKRGDTKPMSIAQRRALEREANPEAVPEY